MTTSYIISQTDEFLSREILKEYYKRFVLPQVKAYQKPKRFDMYTLLKEESPLFRKLNRWYFCKEFQELESLLRAIYQRLKIYYRQLTPQTYIDFELMCPYLFDCSSHYEFAEMIYCHLHKNKHLYGYLYSKWGRQEFIGSLIVIMRAKDYYAPSAHPHREGIKWDEGEDLFDEEIFRM